MSLKNIEKLDKFLCEISEKATSTALKGSLFEKFCVFFLKEYFKDDYTNIWLWNEFPYRQGSDTGIDIVVEQESVGGKPTFIAVQCKNYGEHTKLDDLATFFNAVRGFYYRPDKHDPNQDSLFEETKLGYRCFSKAILISTTDNLSQKARKTMEDFKADPDNKTEFEEIYKEDIAELDIDYSKLNLQDDDLGLKVNKFTPRPHQENALKATIEYFEDEKNTRGKLILACGTGKTYLSILLIEALTDKETGTCLVLVPSIALIGQSYRAFKAQKTQKFVAALVCSDKKAAGEDEQDRLSLPLKASTDINDLQEKIKEAKEKNERLIIISTYHSCGIIEDAMQAGILDWIDLAICDEAHRSVGAMYNAKKEQSAFVKIHNDENIKVKKRIYMSATPKVYTKKNGRGGEDEVYSMDDESIFGKDIFKLGFKKAIDLSLLSDYRVSIMIVKREMMLACYPEMKNRVSISKTDEKAQLADLDHMCKMIATLKSLLPTQSKELKTDNLETNNIERPLSKKSILFTNTVKASKGLSSDLVEILHMLQEKQEASLPGRLFDENEGRKDALDLKTYVKNSYDELKLAIKHIDGKMNANERTKLLKWLDEANEDSHMLSNARCLSEGIDVPGLDTVVFFNGKESQVDIIQAVGRVMRKAPNKEYGYIILPVAINSSELADYDKLLKSSAFDKVWSVVKALRSHDESIVDSDVILEKIKIDVIKDDFEPTPGPDIPDVDIKLLEKCIYNVIPDKIGDRGYWQNFSKSTAKIVDEVKSIIEASVKKDDKKFNKFVDILHENISKSIDKDTALDMCASHVVTKPIFDVLFPNQFANNVISKGLDKFLAKQDLSAQTYKLKNLYENVKENAALAKSEKSKQTLIKNLYDTFFNIAFKKDSEKYGVVYTPIEIVDFILRATNDILKQDFNSSFDEPSTVVYDPFTGTGSFIARLLSKELDLISEANFEHKFKNCIFAKDITLLAYYIALTNISSMQSSGELFKNIILGDSLDLVEGKDFDKEAGLFRENEIEELLAKNEELDKNLKARTDIRVIIGNPPYSAGQKGANDGNANNSHPKLEKDVLKTWGSLSLSKNKGQSSGDTYIQAFRVADLMIKDKGIVGFVTNSGFLRSASADGIRKGLTQSFDKIIIIDLKGNIRDKAAREANGGNVFDVMIGVCIIFFIKNPSLKDKGVFYHNLGDALKKDEKLKLLESLNFEKIEFEKIIPNKYSDWLDQRDESFDKFFPLQKNHRENGLFNLDTLGMVTSRDSFVIDFSKESLKNSITTMITTYNEDLLKFDKKLFEEKAKLKYIKKSDYYKALSGEDITFDESKIKWSSSLQSKFLRSIKLNDYNSILVRDIHYRPFNMEYLYYDKNIMHRPALTDNLFPDAHSHNLVIGCTGTSASVNFSALIMQESFNYHTMDTGKFFPLYTYTSTGGLGTQSRISNISYNGIKVFEDAIGKTVSEEDVFYYVYAVLNHQPFIKKYQNTLSKEAPRVPVVKNYSDFKKLSDLGRELAELHLQYEDENTVLNMAKQRKIDPSQLYEIESKGENLEVNKMVLKGNILRYNNDKTIKLLDEDILKYELNGKAALKWIVDRYQVKVEKNGFVKDPNTYKGGKYIFDLVKNIIVLSKLSVVLQEEISKIDILEGY